MSKKKKKHGKQKKTAQKPKEQALVRVETITAPPSFFKKWRDAFVKMCHQFLDSVRNFLKQIFRVLLFALELILILFVFLGLLFSAYSFYYEQRFVPRSYVLQENLSGLTLEQAQTLLEDDLQVFDEQNFTFLANAETYQLSPTELGINYQIPETLNEAFLKGHQGDFWQQQWERFLALFSLNEIELETTLDLQTVKAALKQKIPAIAIEPENAQVVLNEQGEFMVTESRSAVSTDFLQAYQTIREQLLSLNTATITLPIREFQPEISTEEAQAALEKANLMVTQPLQLTYNEHSRQEEFWIPIPQDRNWISFKLQDGSLLPGLDESKLKNLLQEKVAPAINRTHSNALIKNSNMELSNDPNAPHYVDVVGEVQDGFTLALEENLSTITQAFSQGTYSISLIVDFEAGQVLDEAGRELGIKELVGFGASDFKGSDANRAYNVAHGMKLFNNILIPPGAEFSFNSFLGEVSGRTGWKLAKVIRGNGYIEPDWGGGVCQISTTAYRAILDAGLKVIERAPHSLYVSYYTWGPYPDNNGTGLDATVFLGVRNLRFQNDSPAYLLMKTKVEGTKAYFYLYGTKDREVTLDGPHRGAWYNSGAETVYEETTDLPPGVTEITQKALPGFKVYWTQTIKFDDGRTEENRIDSNYRATPAFGKRGVGTSTTVNLN